MGENSDEGFADLPAWKIVPMALGAVIWVLVLIVVTEVVSDFTSGYVPDILNYSIVGIVVAVLGLTLYARAITRRPLRWFEFSPPDRSTVWWTAFGLGFPAVVTIANVVVRGGEVVATMTDPTGILISILGSIGVALFTATLEEFTFRGIIYRLLEDKWNAAVAILAPALVFSVLHTGRASTQMEMGLVVLRTVIGGVLFGLVVYRTNNLWNAIAVHAGWNFFLGARIVRVAEPGLTPDTALVGITLTETGVFDIAVSATNTPVTIVFLLLACIGLLFRFDERIGLASPESSR